MLSGTAMVVDRLLSGLTGDPVEIRLDDDWGHDPDRLARVDNHLPGNKSADTRCPQYSHGSW